MSKSTRLVVASLVVLMTLAITPLLADDRIVLRLSTPRFQHAPAYVRFTLRVPQNKANRQICVAVDGDTGFYRQSCFEHEGEGARLQTTIEYKDVPAGGYSVLAELIYIDENGKRQSAHPTPQTFRVLGIGETINPDEN